MATDRDGVVHVVWPTLVQGPEPAIGLFHASTRDGVTFTARQRIATLGSSKPSHPQLIADSCGALTLVWDEVQASTRRAVMRQLTPMPSGDVSLGEPYVLSGDDTAMYPVVAPTSDGVVTAWTAIPHSDTDHSRIGVRRVPLDSTCHVSPSTAASFAIAKDARTQPAAQRYPLRGNVISIDRAGRSITIDHEAIPGFMGAMMMTYGVKGAREPEMEIQKGSHITATIVRVGDDYWIEDVRPEVSR
jgi:Cu/Ag efflux protein CusF